MFTVFIITRIPMIFVTARDAGHLSFSIGSPRNTVESHPCNELDKEGHPCLVPDSKLVGSLIPFLS